MTDKDLDILQIGDLITTRIGDWMYVRSLEFEYHGDDPFYQRCNRDHWFVPVLAGWNECILDWGIGSFWRVERDGEIIWQSDLPAIDPQYADLPLFAGLEDSA